MHVLTVLMRATACLAGDIMNTREMHQLRPYCPDTFQCQFQVLEIAVERILQRAHLGTGSKSQVNNYGLHNELVVFSQ